MKKKFFYNCFMVFAITLFGVSITGCGNSSSSANNNSKNNEDKTDIFADQLKEADDAAHSGDYEQARTIYMNLGNEAINKGNYLNAYLVADKMIAIHERSDNYVTSNEGEKLNERALKDEIATIINSDENVAARLIVTIRDRAQYIYSEISTYAEREMFKYALQLAEAAGKDEQTIQILQKAMDDADPWKH